MNRRILAAMLGLGFVGCAQTQVSPTRGDKPMQPVALEPLPEIHQSVNAGLRTQDGDTRLADHRVEPAPPAQPAELAAVEADGSVAAAPANAGAAGGSSTRANAVASSAASASPATAAPGAKPRSPQRSWTEPSPGRALANAGRPRLRADGTREPNPAVASAVGGGGAISDTLRTQTSASATQAAGTDPSLGASPDAMPLTEMPSATEAESRALASEAPPAQSGEPASPANAPLTSANASETPSDALAAPADSLAGVPDATNTAVPAPESAAASAPATTAAALPESAQAVPLGVDPALGAAPDAMPPMDLPPGASEAKLAASSSNTKAQEPAQDAKPAEPATVPATKPSEPTATVELLDPATELQPAASAPVVSAPTPAELAPVESLPAANAGLPSVPGLPPAAPLNGQPAQDPATSVPPVIDPSRGLPSAPVPSTAAPAAESGVPPVVDPAHGLPAVPMPGAGGQATDPAVPPVIAPMPASIAPEAPSAATTESAATAPGAVDSLGDLPPLPPPMPGEPANAGLPNPLADLPPLPPTGAAAPGGPAPNAPAEVLPPLPSQMAPSNPAPVPARAPASGPARIIRGTSSMIVPAPGKGTLASASAPVATVVRLSSAEAPRDESESAATATKSRAAAPSPNATRAPATRAAVGDAPRDGAAGQAAIDETAVHSELQPSPLEPGGMIAARVGDEIITLQELKNAVREYVKRNAPPGVRPSSRELNIIAGMQLNDMIERAIILQEVHRRIKNPKQFDKFKEHIESVWQDEEVPPLLRKYAVTNVYELKEKLKESGRSLDKMHDEFCNTRMAQLYVDAELGPAIRIDLPEMRDYYNAHLSDFDRPAQITWREIVVDMKKYPSRAEARKKAEALLAKLSHGEDFAALAKTESDGPKREQGGLWETSPGSYAVKSVNAAIQSLPLNQVSTILSGPKSYHIVRVEARREAGPARFDEVQLQVHRKLQEEKYQIQRAEFMKKLRDRTFVWSVFDNTESAPTTGPTSGDDAKPSRTGGLRAN